MQILKNHFQGCSTPKYSCIDKLIVPFNSIWLKSAVTSTKQLKPIRFSFKDSTIALWQKCLDSLFIVTISQLEYNTARVLHLTWFILASRVKKVAGKLLPSALLLPAIKKIWIYPLCSGYRLYDNPIKKGIHRIKSTLSNENVLADGVVKRNPKDLKMWLSRIKRWK